MVLILGLTAMFAMTWCFPFLAAVLSTRRRCTNNVHAPLEEPLRLAVLIPVRDDASALAATIRSINKAFAELQHETPLQGAVLVGTDACTDNSAQAARAEGAEVIEYRQQQGKWRVLQELTAAADAYDWIAFVDAGAIWPPDLLRQALPFFRRRDILGIAPSYRNSAAGLLETLHWRLEAHLKRLENYAGGPVSVHGASVIYRRSRLVAALNSLASAAWRNDDVVIPLTLRAVFHDERLAYLPDVQVQEYQRAADVGGERGRRVRMARGNAEWLRLLLSRRLITGNPRVAVLALRRVFRLLWAYWCALTAAGALLLLHQHLPEPGRALLVLGLAAAAAAVLMRRQCTRVAAAACASLASPFYLLFMTKEEVPWS